MSKIWKRYQPQLIFLGVVALLLLSLKETIWAYPFKFLTAVFREFSRASADWLMGGQVQSLVFNANLHVIDSSSQSGSNWVLAMGYLGPLLLGAIFYLVPSRFAKTANIGMGVLLFLIGLWLFRDWLGWLCVLISLAILAVVILQLNATLNSWLLQLLGLVNLVNPPLEVYADRIADKVAEATTSGQATNVDPTNVILWDIWFIAGIMMVWVLVFYLSSLLEEKANSAAIASEE